MGNSRSITRWANIGLLAAALLLGSLVTGADSALWCDETTASRCSTVDTNKNARVAIGASTRPTYIATVGALSAATAHTLSIESGAATGFKVSKVCIGLSNATAAVSINIQVIRRTTASSAGTVVAADSASTSSVSKLDPNAASYPGIVRLDGTPGTAGATVDQQNIQVGIIATGAGTTWSHCFEYGTSGQQMPTVAAGVANGMSITVPTMGAGSLSGSISAYIIAE